MFYKKNFVGCCRTKILAVPLLGPLRIFTHAMPMGSPAGAPARSTRLARPSLPDCEDSYAND